MKFTPFARLALSSAGVKPAATLGEFAIAEGLKSHCVFVFVVGAVIVGGAGEGEGEGCEGGDGAAGGIGRGGGAVVVVVLLLLVVVTPVVLLVVRGWYEVGRWCGACTAVEDMGGCEVVVDVVDG